jgi:mannose-6-phosphate isomerase
MGTIYPLQLRPQQHRRVWGGTWLPELQAGVTSVKGPAGEPVGESWLAGDDSVVANGRWAGETVGGLAGGWGADLVGSAAFGRYGARMPLLAKLLDAAADLSIQVHPDDAYAHSNESASGHLGKSEAWYVLDAAPAATVLWGFKQPLQPEELRAAAQDGTLPGLMHRLPVRGGSVIVNPAGTVHAVGAGVRLYEIQQASDLTYRIYDYGRLGADGQPRQLHLERAVEVADLSGGPAYSAPEPRTLADGWQRLVDQPEFVLDRAQLAAGAPARGATSPSSLQLLTLTQGAARLQSEGGEWDALTLTAGDTVLLPAALQGAYRLLGHGQVLRSAVTGGA